jgi:lipopolysaccharide export system protein LptA
MKFFVLFLLLCAPVWAAEPAGFGGNSKSPLDISADNSLEWDQEARTYTARGGAIAKRDNFAIAADTLVAHERDKQPKGTEVYKMTAEGNVKITNGRDGKITEIYGDNGVYDIDGEVAVLTGQNLKLVNGADTLTAKDKFEYWAREKIAVAIGNAEAVRGGPNPRHIKADRMKALFKEDAAGNLQTDRVEATGGVTIITATDVAKGDSALYDLGKNKAVLTNNVQLSRGKNQLAGDKAEVDFATGLSKLLVGDNKKSRVRGLIYPNDKKEQ